MGDVPATVPALVPASRRRAAAGMLGVVIFVAACGSGSSPATSGTSPHAATPSPSPKPPTPPPGAPPTPALPPGTFAAPVVVQVENAPDARPQSGLANAPLVYEYETEGGISRFSAFFTSAPPTQVGPVRSARLVTIQLLRIYHAVLMYSGATVYVNEQLAAAGTAHYNETSAAGDLFRIHTRFAPHNLYTDGPHVDELIGRVKPPAAPLYLWPRDDPNRFFTGTVANTVTVPISPFERPVFTWHPELSGYTRAEPTGPFNDAGAGKPVISQNVLVLQVPIKLGPEVEDVSGTHGLDHTITGSGAGQLFVAGQQFSVTWTQPASGPPKLELVPGVPAPIAPGQVWICLVHQGTPAAAS